MARLTLEDIEKSPVGEAILEEKAEQERAAAEEAAVKLREKCDEWAAELAGVSAEYETLRAALIERVEVDAKDAERLYVLHSRCKELVRFLRKSGETAEEPQPLGPRAVRQVIEQVTTILNKLGRSL